MRSRIPRHVVLASAVYLVFNLGCDRSENAWQAAERTGTREAYSRFLAKHPRSKFAAEAYRKVDGFVWDSVLVVNSIQAYQGYLSDHSGGQHRSEALQAIEKLV